MFKDELGHLYHQFNIYEDLRNITNYYIEPLGEKKFTITGARNDCTNGYYDICVNGRPLSSDDPMARYCASAMVKMDNVTTKHLHALDDLTFKHAGHYVINGFDDDLAVDYKKKLKFFISKDTKGVWYLDRPKITPVHPYHIPVSRQCVTNLLNRRQAR
jgi:intein-encoded DNA endonuclease-like protein